MYVEKSRMRYDKYGSQQAGLADFLILMNKRSDREAPIRAIVRKAALSQLGQFMMGSVRVKGSRIVLSGLYGGDGLPVDVDDVVYDEGVVLPDHIYEAWNTDNDRLVMNWAIENISILVPKYRQAKMACEQESVCEESAL